MARTHVVPTHLKVPETVLTIGGLNLSVRQFFLLLLGLALGYQLWSGMNRSAGDPAGGGRPALDRGSHPGAAVRDLRVCTPGAAFA